MKQIIKKAVASLGYRIVPVKSLKKLPPDVDEAAGETIRMVNPTDKVYTRTSVERVYGLIQAVRYLQAEKIPGAFVECGVWRGGSMMAIAKTLMQLGQTDRQLILFDTFEGMSAPSAEDVTYDDRSAAKKFSETKLGANTSTWTYASLEDVMANMGLTDYPTHNVQYIKGMVQDTIPASAPETIALLRLDTDWYESTKHEMVHLYDRLAPGGVLIIDDYGHWKGARKAVDEFLASRNCNLFLNRLDYSGRLAIKPK